MMKATRQQSKKHNLQFVLQHVYEAGEISRADLARITKLTRPTISALVRDLMEKGVVAEARVGVSTGGKRPVLLTVPADAFSLVCVEIGNQGFHGAIVDMRGNIIERIDLPAAGMVGDRAVERIYELIDLLIERAPQPIPGIAIGTPGLIDPLTGLIRFAVNLDWADLPLRQMVSSRYDLPVHVVNDSHAAALAEFMFGKHAGENSNVVLIKAGQGISAGIVWQGSILQGDGFGAGEIGQVVVAEQNNELVTLEQVAGMKAVLQRAKELASAEISWDDMIESPYAGQLAEEVGHYIGIAVANLIAALNIQQVLIAGRFTQLGSGLLGSIKRTATQYALSTMVEDTMISFTELEKDIVLLGCSALLLKHEMGIV